MRVKEIFRTSIITLLLTSNVITVSAEVGKIDVVKNLNYKQTVTPSILDNYLFSTFVAADKKAFNLKGFEIANVGGKILDLKVCPAGNSYAIISTNGKRNNLRIFDAYRAGHELHDFGKMLNPQSITYSADSRYLYVADENAIMKKIDSKSMMTIDQWSLPFAPSKMTASNNGYFIAGYKNGELIIINPEAKSIRTTEKFSSSIIGLDFSDDSSLLAVLLSSGEVKILNTRDFSTTGSSFSRTGANAINIHPENKYVALSKNGNEIEFINIIDNFDTASMSEPSGKVSYVRFLKDGKNNIYLTYNAQNSIKYKLIKGLTPNYAKMLREEVVARMEQWSKMAPGESEEEYFARVNDDTRLVQARLFEEEIATRMADNFVNSSTITLGAYNPNDNTLSLEFDNMPPIFLTVPKNDMADFMDVSNLEFRNTIYGVTANDKFELVYAEVYNKLTGKTYEFNNRERKSFDYLYSSDEFVPIELVRQSGMEEVKLTGIRNSIVEQAKQNNLISDHTNIEVGTNIVSDVDASGRQITNYKINFKYSVEAGFSTKEDFPAGKYKISQSNAANSMLQIATEAFANDFAQYIQPGRKVIIKITGSADALPVFGKISYDGSFGDFENEPYLLNGDLSTISLNQKRGISSNEQLAFARALAVKDFIATNIPSLSLMNAEYQYCVELSDKTGGEYRRISVEFTFVDAF